MEGPVIPNIGCWNCMIGQKTVRGRLIAVRTDQPHRGRKARGSRGCRDRLRRRRFLSRCDRTGEP